MGKSCRDMAEALRDCMILEECMSDGSRTLKQCLKLKEYSHECRVRGCSVEGTTIRVGGPGGHCMVLLHSVSLTGYRQAYFECKRGQLDMRTRIRGPKGGLTKPEPTSSKQ